MYAVFISGTTNKSNTRQQIIITTWGGNDYAWSRVTNGGRGEANAWIDVTYSEVVNATYENSLVVGEVIATPLTEVDKNALANGERPNVLIQKMSKQWSSRGEFITTRAVADVVSEVNDLFIQDVSQLEKYRLDGRKSRDVSATKNYAEPTQQVIQVVREQQPITKGERNMNALVIPSKEQIQWYIPRTFNGINEFDIFTHAIKTRKPILMEGHAGTGKTSSGIWNAYMRGLGVSVQSCSAGLQLSDMIGKTSILPNGEAGWIDGALTKAMRYGGGYVLDEIDFAQPKVLQRLQDVATNYVLELHENNGEVINAHPDFFLVATYNNGYKHSNSLNEAVLDRYKIKLYFDYDYEIEGKVIKLPTLLNLAKQMRNDAIQGIYTTPVSMRMLKAFQELATDLNYDFAVENFLMCFNADERPSVRLLMEAHKDQIETEVKNYKIKVGA